MARIKGFAVRGIFKYVKSCGHPGGIAAVLAAVPEGSRELFARPILASGWYPYETLAALVDAVDGVIGDGRYGQMHAIGRDGAIREAGTVFKVVSAVLSYERVLRMADMFWTRTCDQGHFVLADGRDGLVARLEGFPGVAEGHCRMISGWIEGMAAATGREVVASKVGCVHQGGPCCEYHVATRP